MQTESYTVQVIEALLAAGIPFMVVGSFSSNLWGVPRSTKDLDLVLDLRDRSLDDLKHRLPATFHLDLQMQFEGVTGTIKNLITIDGTAFTVELFRLTDDPHDQARFHRRIEHEVKGRKAWFPRAEDVIVTKIRWASGGGRQKDVEDVIDVIQSQEGTLDWDYIHHWTAEHGTRNLLDEILKDIPSPEDHGE